MLLVYGEKKEKKKMGQLVKARVKENIKKKK